MDAFPANTMLESKRSLRATDAARNSAHIQEAHMNSIAAKFSTARMMTIVAFAVLILLPLAGSAQETANVPARLPGIHSLTLQRANEPAIHYAISIPDNYSSRARVPLILALHFGVG